MKRSPFFLFLIIALIAVFIYHHYFFAYEQGIQSGQLINIKKQPSIFTFYTGAIKKSAGADFIFSVSNETLADSLYHCRGKKVTVRYNKYYGKLPWRDTSGYVVNKLLYVQDN